MNFLSRYFLSSVPSVNIFPLLTIVKMTTTTNIKQRKNGLTVSKRILLNRVLFPIAQYLLYFYFENKCRMLYCSQLVVFCTEYVFLLLKSLMSSIYFQNGLAVGTRHFFSGPISLFVLSAFFVIQP